MKKKLFFLALSAFAISGLFFISCEEEQQQSSFSSSYKISDDILNRQSNEIVISFFNNSDSVYVLRTWDFNDLVTLLTFNKNGNIINDFDFYIDYDNIPEIKLIKCDTNNERIVFSINNDSVILDNFTDYNSYIAFDATTKNQKINFTLGIDSLTTKTYFECLLDEKTLYNESKIPVPVIVELIKSGTKIVVTFTAAITSYCNVRIIEGAKNCQKRNLCCDIGLCSVKCIECKKE